MMQPTTPTLTPVSATGHVVRIAGPVVGATGLDRARLFDVVHVGHTGLIGEVIRLSGNLATIQVYEDTRHRADWRGHPAVG